MCGISGIIKKDMSPASLEEIKEMNDRIVHRGPDGEGFYIDRNIAFGHRRLAIIDLSPAGSQPMTWNNKYWITYNGEIYNYIEIKIELQKQGYEFKSNSDTEVILASYHRWGESCISRFRGMWAFAIYDTETRKIFMSRDRFGIKPLYYTENSQRFLFASEIKQLLPHLSKISINPQILFDYIYIGIQHHTESTFFNDVQILSPGHNLVYNLDSNCYTISKYYDIAVKKEIYDLSLQDSVDLYKEELKKSLRFHLRSDVTVGTCLSGGLDSSVIAAIVSNEYRKQSKLKFKAITAKSIDPETDESRYAAKIVNSFDLDWHVTQPTLADLYDSIDTTIKIQEEPFLGLSIAMQYFVMKEARQAGCTVLLDGQGGDETLLGNVRYYATSLKGLNTRQLINSYVAIARNSELSLVDILAYKMYFTNLRVRNLYIKRRSNFVKKDYRQYYNRELITEITKSYQCLETLQHWEVTRAQLPKLLQYEDKNSMHFSIEARVPYLDHQLVETALSISPFHRIHKGWTKYPLREIAREILPPEIAWRKHKFGFEAPQTAWINKYKQDMMPVIRNSDLVNGFANLKKLESFDMDSLWKLYNLAKWADLFEVNSEF